MPENDITTAPEYFAPERSKRTMYNLRKETLKMDEATEQLQVLTTLYNELAVAFNELRASCAAKSTARKPAKKPAPEAKAE